jgi:hypothetical protein
MESFFDTRAGSNGPADRHMTPSAFASRPISETPILVKPWAIPAAFFNRREPSISKRSSLSVSLDC